MSFYLSVAQKGINSPYESLIQSASARYGVPISLIKAIICQECPDWRADCTNLSDPSYGLMQVNTKAHPDVSPQQMLDPAQNIDYGTQYLGYQLNRYGGDEQKAVSAYNAGTAITGNYSNYVVPVLQYRDWFVANDGGGSEGPPPDGTEGTPDWPNDADIKLIAGIVVFGLLAFSLFRK